QVDPPFEHAFELGTGPRTDALDPFPAFAEHDCALTRPLHVDDLPDADAAVRPVVPLLGLDRRGVGKLIMQLQEDLLARDLGRDQTLGGIGELVLRKEPRPCRQAGGEMPLYVLHAVSLETGNYEYGIEIALPRERVD